MLLAGCALLLVLASSCGSEGPNEPSSPSTTEDPNLSLTTGMEETTSSALDQYSTTPGEETTSGESAPEVVIRAEGADGTRFTGVCSVGDERSVLSGNVPRRFEFDLAGGELSCEIQKRTDSGGSLRIVLVAEGQTRSVQQTSSAGGEIRIRYSL